LECGDLSPLSKLFWSAPAERSGDGALVEGTAKRIQSGVALRLPPHSKNVEIGFPDGVDYDSDN
jgi:hypothetical protein